MSDRYSRPSPTSQNSGSEGSQPSDLANVANPGRHDHLPPASAQGSREAEDLTEDLELALENPWIRSKAHPHVHDPEMKRKLINRLARIEGHVHGIRTMIDEQQPCPDVLLQIAAVRGALDRVARLILDDHISHCITHAAETGNIKVELDELKRALDRFIR